MTSKRVLEKYDIVDRLHLHGHASRGAYGKVYVATDRYTGQFVALKRQSTPSQAASDEFRFYKALSQDPHPNVMRLLDHFLFPGGSDLCFVFEFMDVTLWDWWLKRRGGTSAAGHQSGAAGECRCRASARFTSGSRGFINGEYVAER